jgi:PAS domain-containing protein
MRWLFFPPVFSSLLLILSAILHNRDSAVRIPETVWGITVAAYVCLCAVSLFFIMRGETKYNKGIAALAQGLLLSVMSLQLGAMFLSWIGLILFLVGLALTFFYATKPEADDEVYEQSGVPDDDGGALRRIDNILEKLSLPVCYTNSQGIIAGATSSFCEALSREADDIVGRLISELLPVDGEEAILESGTWWITQEKDGARHYFYLSPTPDGRPAQSAAAAVASSDGGSSIYDKATGLYTDEYRKIRGPEEVSRSQRYKRPLSGLLLSLVFEPATGVALTLEQETMLSNAFRSRIQEALRTTDCGFLMGDGRIQLILPETPQAGAKILLSRVITMPQDLFDEEIRTALNPRVKGGMFFYNGASRMEYGIFSAALEEAFIKSKVGQDVQATTNQAA